MQRCAVLFLVLAASVGLSACDDTPVATATSSPAAKSAGTATGSNTSASAFLLHGKSVSAYTHQSDLSLTAAMVASEAQVPTLAQDLQADGYQQGAEAIYQIPQQTVLPFADISSRVYVFKEATGAHAFYTAEMTRVNKPGAGVTVAPLNNAVHDNTDEALALQETNPPPVDGAAVDIGYLGLARRGRVVIELFGHALQPSTSADQFMQLLAAQQATLAEVPA